MSISHPRKIVVNDRRYHWKVSHHGRKHLVIYDPETRKKIVRYYEDDEVITPKNVRDIILDEF